MALMLDTASTAALAGEHELIDAARAGDDRAFEELYARYSERVRVFILGRVHDHGRAEDIAQEVFMSALRRLRTSTQEIAFRPWIYEIARNACIDEYRRSRRTREVSLDADEELVNGRRALHSLAPTPAAAVEGRQVLDDLRGAFGGLSETHHKLLVMRELEGLSYDEIGSRTGMSRPMVESTLFRARRKLAEEYDELASGRRCLHVQTVVEGGRALSARALGVRERRRLARHLAHCQPCRVKAHLAGVDESLLRPRSIADKIAALLPFGIWRWFWRGGSSGKRPWPSGSSAKRALARTGSHPVALQSVQAAASMPDPAGPASSVGAAAAVAAAVIALAGAGGAIVSADAGPGHARRTPAVVAPTAHRAHVPSGSTSSTSQRARAPRAAGRAGAVGSTGLQARPKRSHATSSNRHPGVGSGSGAGRGSAAGAGTANPAHGSSTSTATAKTASNPTNSAAPTVNQAGSTVHKVVKTVKTTAQQTGRTLSKTLSSVSKTVSSTTSSLGKTVSSAGSSLGKTVSSAGSSLGKTVSSAGSSLGKTASSAGSSVSKTVSNTASSVSKTVNGTVSSLTSPPASSSKGSSGAAAASTVTSTVQKVGATVSNLLP